jgi:hypothetical protein
MPKTKESAGATTAAAPRKRATKQVPTIDQVQQRAYEIYLERGCAPGDPMADWIQAERELAQATAKPARAAKPRTPKAKATAA